MSSWLPFLLTHWGQVTHICISNLTTIGSINGLSPGRRQAITWTNAGISLIGPLGTNFSEILIEISTFSFKKMRLKVSSAKWQPFCLSLNVLMSPATSAPVLSYPDRVQQIAPCLSLINVDSVDSPGGLKPSRGWLSIDLYVQ